MATEHGACAHVTMTCMKEIKILVKTFFVFHRSVQNDEACSSYASR